MSSEQAVMPPIRYFWRLIRYSAKYFLIDVSTASAYWLSATVLGLILRAYFDFITSDGAQGLPVGQVVALQLGYALMASLLLVGAILANSALRYRSMALMIRNIFMRILAMPAAQPLPKDEQGEPISAGQVVSTFRDDSNEVVNAITYLEDTFGTGVAALISLAIMISINPWITLGTFLPLVVIILIAERLGGMVKRYRKLSRQATSQVTGLIADMFHGTQAIKVANAEQRVIAHFHGINQQRQAAMVKDRLLTQLVNALSSGAMDLGVGFILLLAASSMVAGDFSVGDFALFIAYIWPLTQFMRMIGSAITTYKQSVVSFQRMETLMQGAPVGGPVAFKPIYMQGPMPDLTTAPVAHEPPLETLSVRGLSYLYPGGEVGIREISFELQRGQLVVITGRIGSGKSTLLKAILGLLPLQAGEIYWNGVRVKDPASFFVPPRCAYTGQVPRLFSDSLKENILLGLPESRVDLRQALYLAVVEGDVGAMEAGLQTQVGPRGMRLSGGQLQRSAAARMFVREPELLVFDDLSSALDVQTEQELWARMQERGDRTSLVVSHRRAVLQRADHILVLKEGRLICQGDLDRLLQSCEEMRAIWAMD